MTQLQLDADDSDLALHAYLDGELGPDEAAEVEARLLADPEALAHLETCRAQRDLIHEAARVPTSDVVDLRTEALQRELARRLRRVAEASRPRAVRTPVWEPLLAPMRIAVVVLLVVGSAVGGWVGHVHLAARGDGLPGYVLEAVGAHRVFATDETYPVEFPAEASREALGWVSAKLGRTLGIPDLEPLGMHLIGTRLLGTKEGPLAQFLYEDSAGQRLSLAVAAHPEDEPVEELRTVGITGLEGVVGYWRDDELDYALVAETHTLQLEAVASLVDGQHVF